jgi:hypothetical protein
VVELGADLVLLLDLVDEALVLLGAAQHVLERHHLLRLGVHHRIDRAGGALTDLVDDLVAEELGGDGGGIQHGHNLADHRSPLLLRKETRPCRKGRQWRGLPIWT